MRPLKNYLLLSISMFISSYTAAAAATPAPLIANIAGRNSINLNGTWRVIVDPYGVGTGMGFNENAKPTNPQELVEYNFLIHQEF